MTIIQPGPLLQVQELRLEMLKFIPQNSYKIRKVPRRKRHAQIQTNSKGGGEL